MNEKFVQNVNIHIQGIVLTERNVQADIFIAINYVDNVIVF